MSVVDESLTRINVMQPWLGEEEVAAVSEVLRSGWVAQGPRVAEFEKAFAESQQVPHAVAVSNCTTALHLALVVAGVGPGDEVVVPSFSFVATANAPTYVGATPVFADVDPITGNLTPATIATAVTTRTRAVIAVDQGGVPLDLRAIRALVRPARHHRDRGRRLRRRVHRARSSGRRGGRDRRVVLPPAQAADHGRGRHADHDRARTGPSGPGGCASTR